MAARGLCVKSANGYSNSIAHRLNESNETNSRTDLDASVKPTFFRAALLRKSCPLCERQHGSGSLVFISWQPESFRTIAFLRHTSTTRMAKPPVNLPWTKQKNSPRRSFQTTTSPRSQLSRRSEFCEALFSIDAECFCPNVYIQTICPNAGRGAAGQMDLRLEGSTPPKRESNQRE